MLYAKTILILDSWGLSSNIKRRIVQWLGIALLVGLVLVKTFMAAASSCPQVQEMATDWRLKPQVFNLLSSSGQQTVLKIKGLTTSPSSWLIPTHIKNQRLLAASSENLRVNNPDLDEDDRTQSETSIAVNGATVVIAFNDFGKANNRAGYAFSTDSGNSFTHQRVPLPPDGCNAGSPVVAFGPDGELYYATLSVFFQDDSDDKVFVGVAKSLNNGGTFSTPINVSLDANSKNSFSDKEWIAVDKGANSPFRGNVYVSWTTFMPSGNYINFSRSTDRGLTFEAPQNLSPINNTFSVQGSMPAVAPNGDLYVAYFDLNFDSRGAISIVKSTDGGRTFTSPILVTRLSPLEPFTPNSVRTNSFPSVAVDGNGKVHIVYNGIESRPGPDRADIFYVRSTDGGNNFSFPVKLNNDISSTTQFMPAIAATGDRLIVKWWDHRNDPINDSLTDVYLTVSTDGGESFSLNRRVTDTNWLFNKPVLGFIQRAGYHGDYDSVAIDNENYYICWSDERNGDPDIYFSKIAVNSEPPHQDFIISSSSTFESIKAGDSVAVALNTTLINGFIERLSFSAIPNIEGINYQFPDTGNIPGQPVKMKISTTAQTKPGNYLIRVSARAANLVRSTSLLLTVFASNRLADTPVNASRDPGIKTAQKMRIDSNGKLHIIFETDTATGNIFSTELLYIQSTDGGQSFSTPIKLTTDEFPKSSFPSMSLDKEGNIFVAWSTLTSKAHRQVVFSKSINGGKSFSAPLPVSLPTHFAQRSSLAVDRNGNILLVYFAFTLTTPQTRGLFVTNSTNGGRSFSKPILSFLGINCMVEFDSKGVAYLVYDDRGLSDTFAVHIAVAKNGKRFKKPKIISNESILSSNPSLAIDKDDNIYISFSEKEQGTSKIAFTRSTDKGASFSLPQIISKECQSCSESFVNLGQDRNINVAWREVLNEKGDLDILFVSSLNKGGSFSDPINISETIGLSLFVSGGSTNNGDLFFSWMDDSPTKDDVFVVRFPAAKLK
ncbi:MAG: sialidase family protein [Acidobacteriota bacterium]